MLRIVSPAVLLLAASAVSAEPEGDLNALQGTWVITEATLAARDHIDDFAGMKLSVAGDTYVIDFAKNSDKGTITLDAAKTPKHIDLATSKEGPFKARNLPGIYELKGDTITICLNSEKADRPTAFEAKEKTPMMLLTFKRDKK